MVRDLALPGPGLVVPGRGAGTSRGVSSSADARVPQGFQEQYRCLQVWGSSPETLATFARDADRFCELVGRLGAVDGGPLTPLESAWVTRKVRLGSGRAATVKMSGALEAQCDALVAWDDAGLAGPRVLGAEVGDPETQYMVLSWVDGLPPARRGTLQEASEVIGRYYAATGIELGDWSPQNAVRTPTGALVPIDPSPGSRGPGADVALWAIHGFAAGERLPASEAVRIGAGFHQAVGEDEVAAALSGEVARLVATPWARFWKVDPEELSRWAATVGVDTAHNAS